MAKNVSSDFRIRHNIYYNNSINNNGNNNLYNNNGNNNNFKKTATYNVSFPNAESAFLSTPKVLNVHFPTFLLSVFVTSTALASHEHGAEGPSARSGRGASAKRTLRK